MSGPYSCFLATTGLKFQMVNEKTDSWKVEPTVVVSEVTTDPHRVSLHGSAYTQIQQGDILYSINGLNFTDWENSNWFNYSFFSKKSSSFQYASLEMLHAMGGGSTPLPTDDSIHFEFKSGSKNGTMYSVEVPYVNYRDDECWNMSSTLYKNLTGVTLAGTPAAESLHDTESLPFTYNTPYHGNLVFKKRGDSVRDKLYQLEMHGATLPTTNSTSNTTDSTAAHALNSTAAFTLHSTASEHIKWGIWSPLDKNLAVVRLDTFMPSVNHSTLTPVADTLEVLRYLLTHQLKYTRPFTLTCEVAGMDNVTLYNTDGLVLSSVTTNQTNIHNVSITADTKYTELGNNHVMLVGSSNGSQVLKTYREVRVVPTRANHHNLLSSNFTLGNVSTHVGVYNHPLTRSDQGWNKQGEAWVVNTNTTNTLGVDTTLESFFVSPVGSNVTVAIHANVDCTPAHDFVYIKVRHANGLIEPFFTSTFDPSTRSVGISGRNKTVDEAFTFTAITDSFSVMLQFVSNAGSLSNVIVHSMAVSTAIESSFRPRSV
ncbi:hypothetical protein BDV3_005770 [Batrachochytrium dendrobatidis]